MIDWKHAAKLLFSEVQAARRVQERSWTECWALARALAKALGTPIAGEAHVSYNNCVAQALKTLGEPPIAKWSTDETVAETRFKQFVSAYEPGQKFDVRSIYTARGGFPRWKCDLIHAIMESPDDT